jgi:DNA-binding GntR family transcriptional regulator
MSAAGFQKIEPVSKKTRVVGLLRDAILSGTIKSGEQIVEGKLAQQFGVGQGLVREALIELEHQGFVQRTPFSSTQVPTLTLQDAQDMFDMRIALEPLAIALAGPAASTADIAELDDLLEKARRGASDGDLEKFFDNHLAFRRKVWQLSGNKYLLQTLERLVVPLYALYLIGRKHNREGLQQTVIDCIEHQEKIMKAYKTGDFDQARAVASDFLVRMKGYLGTRLAATS